MSRPMWETLPLHDIVEFVKGINNRRIIWNYAKGRWESQALVGTEWFVIDASPSRKVEYEFTGVFDRTAGFNNVITDRGAMRSERNGLGAYASVDILGAAMRMTTEAIAGNDLTLGSGDGTGFVHPWNISKDVYYQLRFRLPNAADLAHTYLLMGLYADAGNYIALRFDPDGVYHTADPYLLLVTRSGGVETTTELAIPDNLFHTINIHAKAGSVTYVWDVATTVIHALTIPAVNLAHYFFLETWENAAKNLDLEHLFVLQDNLEF